MIKLSTAPKALQANINELRSLVMSHNPGSAGIYGGKASDNSDTIKAMLTSDANSTGEFYKYYFDEHHPGTNQWADPTGNNLLIAIVARACFAAKNRPAITDLAHCVLDDAKSKLSDADFQKFVDHKFTPCKESDDQIWFHNSAMTLAIKAGLIDMAEKMFEMGANPEAAIGGYGDFSTEHLMLARLPFVSAEAKTREIEFIKKLNGPCAGSKDKFDHTPKELAEQTRMTEFLFKDKIFRLKDEYRNSNETGLEFKNDDGFVHHSMEDIASNPFFTAKGINLKPQNCAEIKATITELKKDFYVKGEHPKRHVDIEHLMRSIHYDEDLSEALKPVEYCFYSEYQKDWGDVPKGSIHPMQDFYEGEGAALLGEL